MEEADLLKERLQAITDKRRIQEDIARKRRRIEEEKLKLQYIKKKALRDQWLMDGLSQQSEEEQEAKRLQAQDEQQQSDQLQSNILRIEKEVEALEAQELSISANEEVILKRLKEVERTAEDIIKEINAEFQPDERNHVPSPLPPVPPFIPLTPAKKHPVCKPSSGEPKKATFAMEISVEHDKRTGKSQVVSATHLTLGTIHERGWKVYDDGRKSVHALHSDGCKMPNGVVGELSPTEVEEMLLQATDKNVPTGVQYHQPVYSVPYTGSSRPSTPRTPNKTPRQTPTPSSSPFQSRVSSRNGAQIPKEENQLTGQKSHIQNPSTRSNQQDTEVQKSGGEPKLPYIPRQSESDRNMIAQPDFGAKTQEGITSSRMDTPSPTLVSVKAKSEGMPASIDPVYRAPGSQSPSLANYPCEIYSTSPFCGESASSPNLVDSLSKELDSGPVTMIFMGYENAEDEEEEDFQAELVVIGDRDDSAGHRVTGGDDREEYLSYHPEGCKSKVFQPKVGVAKVTRCRDSADDFIKWDDLGLHKPTFIHKPGKHSP